MVSVVVPIYNTEKYLRQCIESIVSQTYSDLQIIFVDGDSPDNSRKICEEYAAKDPRITILCHENEGLSSDRNVGIDIAKGEYITFVDGDDFLLPDTIRSFVEAATQTGADIVSGRFIRCDEDDTPHTVSVREGFHEQKVYTDEIKMEKFFQGDEIFVAAWAKLYKTKLFSEILYPVGKNHEDGFTTHKLVHIASKVCCIDEVVYVYRDNQLGLSKSFSESRLDAIRAALERAEFVETNYPRLKAYAYISIIYTCNMCLIQMSKSGYRKKEIFTWMQSLYRQYSGSYLKAKVSLMGKITVLISVINIKFAFLICRTIYKKPNQKKDKHLNKE